MSEKLQKRAELISILNKYTDIQSIDNNQLKKDIETIANFEDKKFTADLLLKELSKAKSIYLNVCSIVIMEAIDNETLTQEALKFLKNNKNDDEKKLLLISLIKQKGIDLDYKDVINNIENTEKLTHEGIEDFLKNIRYSTDTQIDLLDFYLNIEKDERIYFLENLQEEFEGDDLINAFSILIQLDNDKETENVLLEALLGSNSPCALEGLNYILENKKLETKTRAEIKKKIKGLKLKYSDDESSTLILDSEISKCYISFIDGKSNFSLILTRKNKYEKIDMLMFTINISKGVLSCMGFEKIESTDALTIIKRLFNDSAPIEISKKALKTLYLHYYEKSKKNNIELPYELIAWKNLLKDIDPINYDISEFINEKLETINLNKTKVKKFVTSTLLETWYYSVGDNEIVDNLIDKIEKKHITKIETINDLVSETIDKKMLNNKAFLEELQSRLLLESYIAKLAKLKITSSCAYSLCYKNPYLKYFITSMIDKSLYYAFSTKTYKLEENKFSKDKPSNFTKEELENLMNNLEEKWT